MNFTLTMAQLQCELFGFLIIGFICKKIGIINDSAKTSLSDLLIYVILPSSILHSFTSGVKVSSELIQNCGLAFIISFVIQLIATYGGRQLFKKWPQDKSSVANYGMIVSNSSFIGIPVNERIYGDIGVLYTAVFQIPIRFTMWSAGLSLFTSVNKKETFKKVITHPCILACILGFLMMLGNISFLGILEDIVTSLNNCTSPFSMLVIGAILATADRRQIFSKDVLIFCFFRLIAFPVLVWGFMKIFDFNETLTGVTVLLTAMPAGSTTAILPQKYNANAEYGAALIFTSALLSIITIPMLGFLLV
jgi:predicted permease